MYEIPEAKRVRREDLAESQDSPWTIGGGEGVGVDADLWARLDAQIAETLGINVHDRQQQQQQSAQGPLRPSAHDDEAGWDDASDAGEFEFRLFKSTTAPTKVVLESNDAAAQGQGTLVRRRPASFYLADNITDTLKQEYDFAAVTGEDVVLRSQRPSWGMGLPWRVTAVTITRSRAEPGQLGVVMMGSQDEEKRRKRPGKKKRIAVRKRLRAKMDKKEAVAKKALEKEEHLQEKRKRLNRLKKLRRRAKDKEKRALGTTDNAEEGSDSQ